MTADQIESKTFSARSKVISKTKLTNANQVVRNFIPGFDIVGLSNGKGGVKTVYITDRMGTWIDWFDWMEVIRKKKAS
jgi:hypothetical protein